MKKNFFKKLSFVMALAMIVSVIAPAAGVFAAAKLTLNSTNKTLHLSGEPGSNKYNFNINGKKEKGWKYNWTSSNDDVVEVNASNGVATATGIGSAKVTVVIKDSKGKEVQKIPASVTVKDNIKTVKIANAPDKAIAIGDEYDFDRSFVTLSGVTEKTGKTTAITRWSVENTDKATITENDGKFKATEAGKYTVVARSFQSKAKYEAWKTSKDASLLLDDDSVEVTVKAAIKETKQYNLNKFTVEFDSDMSKAGMTKDNAKVYQVINGRDIETGTEKIKELKVEGKKVTVELYTDFKQETDYKFTFGEYVGTFKSAKVDLSKVASIEFNDLTANINGTASKLVDFVIGKNADGVIIYTGNVNGNSDVQNFNNALSFEMASTADTSKAHLDTVNKLVYVYTEGYTVPATAKFTYYHFNEATQKVETITWTDAAVVTGVRVSDILNTSSIQFAVQKDVPANWDGAKWNGPYKLAAQDEGFGIFTRFKYKEEPDWAGHKDENTDKTGSRFYYESTNTDKLIIQGNRIYPAAEGVVTVLVRDMLNNNVVVGTLDITISAARGFASVVTENGLVTANNHATYGTKGFITNILVKDTVGDAPDFSKSYSSAGIGEIKKLSGPDYDLKLTAVPVIDGNWWNFGKIAVSIDAQKATMGNYQYKVPVFFKNKWMDAYVNIQVREANTDDTKDLNDVTSWRLDIGKADDDLKDVDNARTLSIRVAGYNKNNMKVYELPTSQYSISITKDGVGIASDRFDKENLYYQTVSGGALLLPMDKGAYIISATVAVDNSDTKKAKGAVIGSQSFTLKNSTELKFDFTPVVAPGTVKSVVKDAFKFFVNGGEKTDEEANIVGITYVTGAGTGTNMLSPVASGESILIKEIQFKVTYNNGNYVIHKFEPNLSVKAK